MSHAEAEATTLLEGARAAAGRRGVALEIVRESGSADRLPQLLARHARHTDLTVIGQPDLDTNGVDDALLVEAGFMDSGHAALVVPRAGVPQLPPRSALIVWDGSREAARATTDALPLLRHAERTVILVVDADAMGGRVGAPPGADLAAHLSRHQVKAEVKLVASGSAGIADVLLAQVRDSQADLLVMGGYGHSRLREMLLGGVTRHMLERMTVPIVDLPLMATEAPTRPCASEPCPAARLRAEHAGVSGPLLLVEPSPAARASMQTRLVARGFAVTAVPTIQHGEATVGADRFTHAVVNLRLGDGHGLELVQLSAPVAMPAMRIVVVTDVDSFASVILALRAGADDYIAQPVDDGRAGRRAAGSSARAATGPGHAAWASVALAGSTSCAFTSNATAT